MGSYLLNSRLQVRVLPGAPQNPSSMAIWSLPCLLGCHSHYVNGYVNPYVIPYALGVRIPGFGGRGCLSTSVPLRGGAAAPSGALRAIDPSARPRSWVDLRSAPPKAAIRC
jgi:hypothetical protein